MQFSPLGAFLIASQTKLTDLPGQYSIILQLQLATILALKMVW